MQSSSKVCASQQEHIQIIICSTNQLVQYIFILDDYIPKRKQHSFIKAEPHRQQAKWSFLGRTNIFNRYSKKAIMLNL